MVVVSCSDGENAGSREGWMRVLEPTRERFLGRGPWLGRRLTLAPRSFPSPMLDMPKKWERSWWKRESNQNLKSPRKEKVVSSGCRWWIANGSSAWRRAARSRWGRGEEMQVFSFRTVLAAAQHPLGKERRKHDGFGSWLLALPFLNPHYESGRTNPQRDEGWDKSVWEWKSSSGRLETRWSDR